MSEAPTEARANEGLSARLRALLFSPGVRQRVLGPMGFDVSILFMNLLTGIVIARALGPSGRGEIAAILLLGQIAGWIFSLGSTEAVSFRLSRNPAEGARLLGSWLFVSVPLTVLAIAVAELVLPVLFAAQSAAAIDLARIYLAVVALMMAQAVLNGMLLGDEDFFTYNLVRFTMPAIVTVGYLTLLISGALSVELALAVNAAGAGAAVVVATLRSVRRHGIGPPDRRLLRETVWYGVRAHAGSLAGLVNARLDLLIIPAFLAAASVGLYSVATNVTSVIGTLTGTIALLVLPVAARQAVGSARTVVRTMHAVFLIGIAIAVPLGILADLALELIYGDRFGEAATALRLLLPGQVLDAAAMVLWAGLLAANRPFLSSVAAAPAAILTVTGLILFLESGGINAAAIVTTTAHTVVFTISILLYRRAAGLRWRDFVFAPAR